MSMSEQKAFLDAIKQRLKEEDEILASIINFVLEQA